MYQSIPECTKVIESIKAMWWLWRYIENKSINKCSINVIREYPLWPMDIYIVYTDGGIMLSHNTIALVSIGY